jgi:hypothetical protein
MRVAPFIRKDYLNMASRSGINILDFGQSQVGHEDKLRKVEQIEGIPYPSSF